MGLRLGYDLDWNMDFVTSLYCILGRDDKSWCKIFHIVAFLLVIPQFIILILTTCYSPCLMSKSIFCRRIGLIGPFRRGCFPRESRLKDSSFHSTPRLLLTTHSFNHGNPSTAISLPPAVPLGQGIREQRSFVSSFLVRVQCDPSSQSIHRFPPASTVDRVQATSADATKKEIR